MSEVKYPNGAIGKVTCLSVPVGKLGRSGFHCPMKIALNARIGFTPSNPVPRGRDPLEDFNLEPIMRALDRLEDVPHRSASAAVHEGHARWAEHAVRNYVKEFSARAADIPPLIPLSGRTWKAIWDSSPGAMSREIAAWGRRYISSDRTVCELRMMTFRRREEAVELRILKATAAAYAIARAEPDAQRIRVVDFACLEGTSEVRFDGSREEVRERYNRDGRPAVTALLNGREYQAGSSCVDCRFIADCPAVLRAPGLLGLTKRSIRRRLWSPSQARNYRACPARHFLRDRLHLPIDGNREFNAAAERGRAVHRALAAAHSQPAGRPCPTAAPGDWYPDRLPPREIELGTLLIEEHAEVCPRLHLPPTAELWSEPQLTIWDSAADVVVVTTPDLLYDDAGSTVWREVKTGRRPTAWSGDPLNLPQLSLGVLLLRHGLLGSGPRRRVELEILRPARPEVVSIDPFNDAVCTVARRVIDEFVMPWHADDLFRAAPGDCDDCVVAHWCPSCASDVRIDA
ncbi:PD-(D/E)XK nuclease family protein [Nocardia terpenica]|uniref:PD-(D/E)XK nuclease family protein n=1 Tax=Nocardia terpenica TaxID=455432 RepID=UPI002FE22601